MAKKITTLIEQFSVNNGQWQASAYNQAAVREPKGSQPSKGNLFVLAEAQGQISQLEAVEKHVVALVRDAYYPAKGGVTASLRRALQTANTWLFQQNSTTTADKRVVAGVVAVVVKDDDLFVAQVGPTAIYSQMQDTVQRYPARSDWLDHEMFTGSVIDYDDITEFVLGIYHYVDPRVTHLQIQNGDVIVLTDGRLARHLPIGQIAPAIQAKNIEAISQNLASLIQIERCSAMILQVTEDVSIKKEQTLSAPSNVPAQTEVLERGGFNFTVPAVLQKPLNLISPKQEPVPQAPLPTSASIVDRDEDHNEEVGWHLDIEREIEADSGFKVSISEIVERTLAIFFGGITFLGNGLHTILKLVLPGVQSETVENGKHADAKSTSTATANQPSLKTLKYVALLLPLVIIAFGLLYYRSAGTNRDAEYTEHIVAAQQIFSQAQQASPEQAALLLQSAEQTLNEAAAIKEDQPEIATLQADIIAQRDEIGQVERLHYIPELQQYQDPGTELERVIIQGVDIYVLDTGLNRLYRHTLDSIGDTLLPTDEDPLILRDGQDLEGTVVTNFVDMAWIPAAGGRQTSDLVVLTSSGLLEYNPDWGGSPIPVASADQWQTPTAVSNYFGNFYLLDNQTNSLYRYKPGIEGYEDIPENYFLEGTFVNLAGAVDMAIDGHIYVLYQNGEIKRFLGGEPAPFAIEGLDIPFKNPTSIFTAPDDQIQYLYVADAGNRRIVQLTKEGVFMRQFKPRYEDEALFGDLRSIYVDEISQKIFVLSGTSLFAPNIPVK